MRLPLIAAAAAAVALATVPAAAAPAPTVVKSATLPAIGVSTIQPSIANDRGVDLGGIGSGLFAVGKNEYWTITDRGPNGDAPNGAKTFVLPEFTPHLVKVRVRGTSLQMMGAIPITTASGQPVTGLPNFAVAGDTDPYLSDGLTVTDYNPNGLDTEGVVRAANGDFWVVDEYGPSIVHISTTGRVIARYVAEGTAGLYNDVPQLDGSTVDVDYPVIDSLPVEFAGRRSNRGFEDIALLPDGHTVVVALQSPYDKKSLVTRLLTFDTATGDDVATYSYTFDDAATFTVGGVAKPGDLKISAVIPINATHVIVEERTDAEARFYKVALDGDADIAGADKLLVANLAGVAGVPGKIEGAALKTPDTLVVISDNDFGFDTATMYPLGDDVISTGVPSTLVEITLR